MSLSISSEDFATFVNEEFQLVMAATTAQLYTAIVSKTPVDTGQVRASWNLSKDSPNFTTVDEGTDLPPPQTPKLRLKKYEYPLVFISNGKPYVDLLESGSSRQAPAGMVAISMAEIS
jgi:hypothetical protein